MSEVRDLLQSAATRLSETAGRAYPGPWYLDDEGNLHGGGTDIAAPYKAANGEYMALMHPGVALSLAKVFDEWARMVGLDPDMAHRIGGPELIEVARRILEEGAPS